MMLKTTLSASLAFLLCTSLIAADYYWVGGSGDWSDISHWATTSGGSTFHNQAPTSDDNVFFDGNSFNGNGQTVTVNTDIVFCRNMNWTGASGNPVFVGSPQQVLSVYGSIILNANMDFNFPGEIRMSSLEPGQSITTNGHQLGKTLTFEGVGGEWELQDPLNVDSLINLRNGVVRTNGVAITTAYLDLQSPTTATLEMGSSKVTVTGLNYSIRNQPVPAIRIHTNNLVLNMANTEIELTNGRGGVTISGNQPVNIGSLVFSASEGTAKVEIGSNTSLNTDRLRFGNSAVITGQVNTGALALAAGKAYTFDSDITYNIGSLSAPGQCEAPIQIFGSISGTPAFFSSASGPIQVAYASIKDIHGIGGANFTANNSADLGNNDGWTINASSQNELYWVGGTGDWDDSAHWSFTSGGAGGACVPTGADNVFFDANSFGAAGEVVTINVENALCRNMDWSGASGMPVFAGNKANSLRIYGSLRFIPNMMLDFEGSVYFESSTAGNTITTGNLLFNQNVFFNGRGGAWSLNDTLQVDRNIQLISGFLTTNNQTVVCEKFLSTSTFDRQLLLGESHIIMRQINLSSGGARTCEFWLQSDNLVFDAGTSWIDFTQFGYLRTDGSGTVNYYEVTFNWYGTTRNDTQATVYVHNMTFFQDGAFLDRFTVGTLNLTPGFEYFLASWETFTFNNINAVGSCDSLIYIHSMNDNQEAFIDSPKDQILEYVILRDVHNISGDNFTANNSVDLDNNMNWQINDLAARTLYWVGGDGDWSDQAHWSLSSGGSGGECIPTPIDDVFFDENSFSAPGQLVNDIMPKHYCHNLTWQNITTTPRLELLDLYIFGSLEFADDMEVYVFNTRFAGDEAGHTINTRAHELVYAYIAGEGDWMLQDSFLAYSVGLEHGGWNTNGYAVNLEYFYAFQEELPKHLKLGGSHITVTAEQPSFPWSVSGNITLEADSSLIELTSNSATFYNRVLNGGELVYNEVLFSAKAGRSVVNSGNGTSIRANHMQFNNNGVIYGSNTFDTLIFAPGKAYQLQALQTQTIVDHWQIIGNNCVPIQLSSTEPGIKSTAFMASGRVNGDFIQMSDQEATGGAEFYAGTHSTNVGNSNTGWIFDSAEDFVETGFLGKDVILCNDNTIVLDADNKGPDETYAWQDGSTESTFTVPGAGTYWAEVSFTNNCTIRDSIQIIPQDDFMANVGNDTTLCTGADLLLDATFDALGVTYLWHDGSTMPTFLVDSPGEYKVELELSGCTVRDSMEVTYFDPPVLDVAEDQTLCFGTTLALDANITDAVTYTWQDGTDGAVYNVATPGTYWVDVDFAHCVRRDSVLIDYYPEVIVDIGSDTTLCENETLLVDAAQPDAVYAWQDGSTAASFTVSEPAIYWVDVSINGCTERDSLEAFYTPLPVFDLGPDLRPCEDDLPQLSTSVAGATYAWQDGSTQADFTVSSDGIYWLDVTKDGCSDRDSVIVEYIILPDMVLGEDRTLCEGEQVDYDVSFPGARYSWQDGSTNPLYTITTSGDYTVAISVEQCNVEDEVSILFNPTPTFTLPEDTLLCQGDNLNLRINTFADEYRWSDGSSASSLTVSYPGGTIWGETELDGCTFRDEIVVAYQEPPQVDLGRDTLICEDFSVMLSAGVVAESYLWQDGSTSRSIESSGSGLYSVEVVDGPCMVTDSVFVGTRPCVYFEVFVPNAFSPNGDGINDVLRPMISSQVQISKYNFKVYDRWGTEVFTSANLDDGWDGMLKSLPLPMGVYIYFVEFDYMDDRGGGSDLITGDVMLIR
ncbi:gliding motility-associated C-terminal domain-containing protein [Flavilitoribacter nigricans]|uniref:Gliding motility-associated C-terminal domain-containing protein n=1 Tax=Flavilitoribacter nigricans (strain ATCC 23147 / DSM 23189 / NBRC 102662 / NCIMB 1420 / SS-2) TaxID=1122177 RepID=A0A2D0NAQ9_FLAN2|nr:gliding motility-associated C-terminal domain-containing protein [Flavilitoribacter nigricans]PHN05602.1 hypothetical protein CRP01_16575 [Flavilitoribacter nigricans DSM 23189 = NBRC 102662]